MGRGISFREWLNVTAPLHNGLKYHDFITRISTSDANKSSIARDFGVSRRTIYKWIERHKKTKTNGDIGNETT